MRLPSGVQMVTSRKSISGKVYSGRRRAISSLASIVPPPKRLASLMTWGGASATAARHDVGPKPPTRCVHRKAGKVGKAEFVDSMGK
jgi:hypothetical protein